MIQLNRPPHGVVPDYGEVVDGYGESIASRASREGPSFVTLPSAAARYMQLADALTTPRSEIFDCENRS
jgi:hypothetical protein